MISIKKQRLLIEYLLSSADVFALCVSILDEKYFHKELRKTIVFIKQYYDEHSCLPSPEQIEVETEQKFHLKEITLDKIDYCTKEIEQFCRIKAIEIAALSIPKLIRENDFGKVEENIKDAVTISLNRNLGINFFESSEDTIRQLLEVDSYEPTGWNELDQILGGGLARRQMLLFSANSGGGKSLVMQNLGLNYALKGYNVVIISLELPEDMIYKRFINMVTGKGIGTWRKDIDNTSKIMKAMGDSLGRGNLHITRMRHGTNSNEIRSYLKEYELKYNKRPDVIIVDYISLMNSNEKVSSDNIHEKDKQRSEQLREIGEDYNAIIITAAQQNRGAVNATELDHSHIAGGISKIDTTDTYISIIMTETMRAQHDIAFQFLKTRSSDGVGKTIHLTYNPISLRITDNDQLDTGFFATSKKKEINTETKDKEEETLDENDIFNLQTSF